MQRLARPALFVILAGLSAVHAAESPARFHPPDAHYVVLESAAARAEQAVPRDPRTAVRLAQHYLDLARSLRDPRFFGRAEAALKPWVTDGTAPAELLVLQADIQQNRHDFAGARGLLDRAIAADPAAPRARLMRATLAMVLGEPTKARTDCTALMGLGQTAVGTVCLAQSMAGTGQLQRAVGIIEMIVSGGELGDPSIRAWALTTLADLSLRTGNSTAAETQLRAALEASPQDESIRSSLIDVLIVRGAATEAVELSDLPRPSVGLLVRRLMAQSVAADERRSATLAQIQELLRLEGERSERVHLREETLLALSTGRPAQETLVLARENFAAQREAIDARLLARAASNARDERALAVLREWRDSTGFQDRLVDDLLSRGARS